MQRVTVVLTDDLDGSEATETVRFALDKLWYEIDLNPGNAEKLRGTLGEWISHARRTGIAPSRSAADGGKRSSANPDNAAVRDWARENGHEIGGHGRVPAHVRALYEISLKERN
jgi:nucleoid-associated protein Lsr2